MRWYVERRWGGVPADSRSSADSTVGWGRFLRVSCQQILQWTFGVSYGSVVRGFDGGLSAFPMDRLSTDSTVGWGCLEVVVDVDTYLEGVSELTEGEGCARR